MPNYYDRLADAAARFADRTAIEVVRASETTRVSYRALGARASEAAAWLNGRGVARGDRVAILADNDAEWIAVYFGVLRLGAVAVPLDTAYHAPQVRAVLESCRPRVVFAGTRYHATAIDAAGALGEHAPEVAELGGEEPQAMGSGGPPPVAPADAADPAVILYTSGTTSDPKGVILTHGNLDAERQAAFALIPVSETDAILGVLPLFHALAQMANLLLPLAVGGRVVFLERISSTTLLEALQQRGITLFACVPQFFYLIHQRVMTELAHASRPRRAAFRVLLRTNGWCRDRLGWNPGVRWFARVHRALGPRMRVLVTGGSKFDPVVGRDLYDMGFRLLNAYGLTECSGAATLVRPDDRYSTTVGQPLPGVEVRVAPRAHDADAETRDGEVLIRGPIVMAGYFNRPDATAEALDGDGWLHTGDLGLLDAQGRLSITGRKKEIIVLASGKNLYPEEIEAHYRQSPFIKELCVLGLTRPDQPSAERLHAVIVPDADALQARGVVNVRELVRFEVENLSVDLPAYKRILTYDVVFEPLPRTSTNKLRRHEIARQLAAHQRASSDDDRAPLAEDERAWMADEDNAVAVALVAERLGRAAVRPGANLELDLGLDSMERVELLTLLERRAGRQVSSEVRATIFSVRQLVDAVRGGAEGTTAVSGDAAAPWPTLLAERPDPALEAQLRRPKFVRALVGFAVIKVVAAAARVCLGLRVSGAGRLPRRGGFLVCPNHQSYLDGFVLAAALPFRTFRRLFFVGAAEYFQTPLMAWVARVVNIVPVDPDANLVSAMQAGAAGLRLDKVLILFPEGERSIDGSVKPFRKGAAILSAHLGAPIVPVALAGLFALWPRRRPFNWRNLLPWHGAPVRVAFGPPVQVEGEDYATATTALQRTVQRMADDL